MDIDRKLKEFNKRWNIPDDSSHEEEFGKFRTRILNICLEIDYRVTEEGILDSCQILGMPIEGPLDDHGTRTISRIRYGRNIIKALEEEKGEKRFYRIVEIIANLPFIDSSRKDNFISRVQEAIDGSNINCRWAAEDNQIILYPRGERELDQKLVDQVLSFLTGKSQGHFIDALRSYEKGTPKDSIESADHLRRCLEEFFRIRLQNGKGLDANISDLGKRLKEDGRDPIVRNIIFQTFSYLDQYFNENSKHQDGEIDSAENEFLIYQTGLLMRYVNTVVS